MICAFCGTENREANRFCGMCGVRLERRKAERRTQHGASLKCESCGHVNEPGYKFCGMCGARIERRMSERRGAPAPAQTRTEAGRNAVMAAPEISGARKPAAGQASATGQQRTSGSLPRAGTPASVFRSDPDQNLHSERGERIGIQGPSFLGLSDEPEDDTGYLLEEENSSGSGLRRLVLLVILAAIIGLIFVQYRSSLRANPKPAEPSHTLPQGQNQPAPAATAPQQQSVVPPAGGPAGSNPQPAAQDAPPVPPQRNDAAAQVTPAKAETSLAPELNPANAAETSTSAAPDLPGTGADSAAAENALNVPLPAGEKPSPTLVRAQQFLHGRGVKQNCEQGLLYLRAAAQKNEPAAAVQMGALYVSGHCVHQDRVIAYRWFNSAHELQPANQWILKNMNLLWDQMTEQEHRLAAY